jgi:hypothetical protein
VGRVQGPGPSGSVRAREGELTFGPWAPRRSPAQMLWEAGGSWRGGGQPGRVLRREAERSPDRARVRGWAGAGSREEGGDQCGPSGPC